MTEKALGKSSLLGIPWHWADKKPTSQ